MPKLQDVARSVAEQLVSDRRWPPPNLNKIMGSGYRYDQNTIRNFLVGVYRRLADRNYTFTFDQAFATAALGMAVGQLIGAIDAKTVVGRPAALLAEAMAAQPSTGALTAKLEGHVLKAFGGVKAAAKPAVKAKAKEKPKRATAKSAKAKKPSAKEKKAKKPTTKSDAARNGKAKLASTTKTVAKRATKKAAKKSAAAKKRG